jgi:hypothetical protein
MRLQRELDQDGAGKGRFPFFRFYRPTEPYFCKTWKIEDIHFGRKTEGTWT